MLHRCRWRRRWRRSWLSPEVNPREALCSSTRTRISICWWRSGRSRGWHKLSRCKECALGPAVIGAARVFWVGKARCACNALQGVIGAGLVGEAAALHAHYTPHSGEGRLRCACFVHAGSTEAVGCHLQGVCLSILKLKKRSQQLFCPRPRPNH